MSKYYLLSNVIFPNLLVQNVYNEIQNNQINPFSHWYSWSLRSKIGFINITFNCDEKKMPMMKEQGLYYVIYYM